MQNDLISILIPFKNTAHFLPECMDSIVSQTYKNWELIIVDDHSTDSSYDIVKEYADKDSRIRLVKNSGNGIIEALRFAFSLSNGNYITRMDSDDIMLPNKLAILLKNITKHGKNHVAIGLVSYFSSEGIGKGYARYEAWLNSLTTLGTNYSEIYKECVIPSPCWMIHKDDLIACDAFNPDRYPEDYDLTFRMYKHNIKCIPCNHVLHRWRDYSTRTSRTHEHYAENHFLEIKLAYFLELEYNPSQKLTVWGAGAKGKFIARLLKKKNIPFYWICDNPKKIGKDIYDERLYAFSFLKEIENPQSIITVANENAQNEIKKYFEKLEMTPMKDYFFFC